MYQVLVDDNFHFMDESRKSKSFATADEAVAHCKRMVDEDLAGYLRSNPGIGADKLFEMYAAFGDDPFIRGWTSRAGITHGNGLKRCAPTRLPDSAAPRQSPTLGAPRGSRRRARHAQGEVCWRRGKRELNFVRQLPNNGVNRLRLRQARAKG
jgi:hypothetical protein